MYHRIPEDILDRWKKDFDIEDISSKSMEEHYKFVEKWLKVRKSDNKPSLVSDRLISSVVDTKYECEQIPRWKSLKNIFYDVHKEIVLYD